ncbi:MAG: YceI family protein [Burkholderiaceae bacterium]
MPSGLTFRNCVAGLVFSSIGMLAHAADVYDIDPQHTFSAFEYNHWGLSYQQGRFDSTQGFIQFSPETRTGEIVIEIDAASVNTGTESFNQLLRSADFFDVENHPKIVFKSSALRFDGESLSEVEGILTVKGIEQPVTLKINQYHCRFMLIYGAQACGANASAAILRSDFDLGRYVPFVSDRIDLHIRVEAIRRNPPAEPSSLPP